MFLIVDRDFRRPISLQGDSYYHPADQKNYSIFWDHREAEQVINLLTPICPANPLMIIDADLILL